MLMYSIGPIVLCYTPDVCHVCQSLWYLGVCAYCLRKHVSHLQRYLLSNLNRLWVNRDCHGTICLFGWLGDFGEICVIPLGQHVLAWLCHTLKEEHMVGQQTPKCYCASFDPPALQAYQGAMPCWMYPDMLTYRQGLRILDTTGQEGWSLHNLQCKRQGSFAANSLLPAHWACNSHACFRSNVWITPLVNEGKSQSPVLEKYMKRITQETWTYISLSSLDWEISKFSIFLVCLYFLPLSKNAKQRQAHRQKFMRKYYWNPLMWHCQPCQRNYSIYKTLTCIHNWL